MIDEVLKECLVELQCGDHDGLEIMTEYDQGREGLAYVSMADIGDAVTKKMAALEAERDALQVENHRKSTLLGNIAVEYTGLSNSNHYGEYFKSLIALAFAEIEDSPSTQEGE